ncbi:MAG: phosphonate C-P lyase system protein PhnH [Brevinematales bacterium]
MFDEVIVTQKTFRILMNAMANPGKFYSTIMEENLSTLEKICLTLLDHEVRFSIVGEKVKEENINRIIYLTGSRYTTIEEADYVILNGNAHNEILNNVKIGTLEEPENGATLIYNLEKNNLPQVKLKISGPGIKDFMEVNLTGITREEIEKIKKINLSYPLGVDVIFCYEDGIMCLPRSTMIDMVE